MMKYITRTMLAILLLVTLLGSFSPAQAQPAPTFADPAFRNVWTRTDSLVAAGQVQRSWYWGPQPNTGAIRELYAESGDGTGYRTVQYFDKSRMEINNPRGNTNDRFYVTNGLLAREMIEGKVQVGNDKFTPAPASQSPLASDLDDTTAPTYASFRAQIAEAVPSRVGQVINSTINKAGQIGTDASYNNYGVTNFAYEPATKHNIPDQFWRFLNTTGPVIENGRQVNARLSDPYFYATGYPISEAYWASVKIAGQPNTAVLIQVYERRVLTYVPTAPAGFKVQMGNIGQHYYGWRYGNADPSPEPTVVGNDPGVDCASQEFRQAVTNSSRTLNKLWLTDATVRIAVGCPADNELAPISSMAITRQQFQRGVMLAFSYTSGGPNSPVNKFILVLFDDGTARRYEDTFVDGTKIAPLDPPAGLFAPNLGFGKLWRQQPEVQAIGWGIGPEHRLDMQEFYFFQKGLLIQNGPRLDNIWVLTGTALNYDRWRTATVELADSTQRCVAPAGPGANLLPDNQLVQIWRRNLRMQAQLGCPHYGNLSSADPLVYIQHFEQGMTIRVVRQTNPPASKDSSSPDITVLLLPGGTLTISQAGPLPTNLLGPARDQQTQIKSDGYQFFQHGLLVMDGDLPVYFYSVGFFYYAYPDYWEALS